jgi:hypothetical protein
MAMVVLTWLHLFTLEQVAGRDIEPARNRFHQLIAGDWEAIHIAAAGYRIPGMRQRRDSDNQRRNNEQCHSHQRKFAISFPPNDAVVAPLRTEHSLRLAPRSQEGNQCDQQTNENDFLHVLNCMRRRKSLHVKTV